MPRWTAHRRRWCPLRNQIDNCGVEARGRRALGERLGDRKAQGRGRHCSTERQEMSSCRRVGAVVVFKTTSHSGQMVGAEGGHRCARVVKPEWGQGRGAGKRGTAGVLQRVVAGRRL